MKTTTINATTLPDAWFQSLYTMLNCDQKRTHEYIIDRGSYEGQRRLEFDFVTINIKNPSVRPLTPEIPPAYGIPNPVDSNYLSEYILYLMTSAKKPNEVYTYGEYLEPQIKAVIEMYKNSGRGTNQAYMAIGDKNSIYQADPPCLRGIDTRIENGQLHFFPYFRSWDLWGGFPANLAALQVLKEYMSDEIGVKDGGIVATSKGLHLYEYAWGLAKTRIGYDK